MKSESFDEWYKYMPIDDTIETACRLAWNSAISNSEASHSDEVKRLKEEIATEKSLRRQEREDRIQAEKRLSAANAAIKELEGMVARQYVALMRVSQETVFDSDGTLHEEVADALNATAETVQAFRDKLTEPLLQQVAMLRSTLQKVVNDASAYDTHYPPYLDAALSNTQATAEAFVAECEQRGAVKALEDAADYFLRCGYQGNVAEVSLRKMAAERRATSKKG